MIAVRQVEPDESFYVNDFPGGRPLFCRWVAITDDRRHFPGWTRDRALKRARRYLRDRENARATLREFLGRHAGPALETAKDEARERGWEA